MSLEDEKKEPIGFATVEPVSSPGRDEVHIRSGAADEAAIIASKFVGMELDPVEADRVRRKIDRNIMPMMMALYAMQFVDKTTLNQGAVLGIKTDCNLSATQFNLLASLFYIAYLAFEFPQNWALQRFPVGKWMAFNVTLWSIFLCCFAACHNFAGLAILRVGLGACEGSITAGFLIVTSMFYTHAEQSRRVGYWFLMNGTAQIVSGLLGFAVLQAGLDRAFKPWRIFFLLTGGLTLLVAIAYWVWFPDSPTNARFLTEEEKIIAVERIRDNNAGIENKTWKRSQFFEALLDWKVWAFALLSAVNNLPNSLTTMSSQVISLMGFETWQTVLLGCVSGVIEILTIYASTLALKRWPNERARIGAIWMVANVLGAALVIGLPFSNRAGQLVSLYLTGVGTPGFVLAMALVNAANTGHTKKTTANAIFLIGYCLGNLLAPLMWEAKYKPHYIVPWVVILVSYVVCIFLLLAIRWGMKRENDRRDKLSAEDNDPFGYIDEFLEDGSKVTHKIDKAFMDLTDKENLSFRYPL